MNRGHANVDKKQKMPVFMSSFCTCHLVKTDLYSLQLWVFINLSIQLYFFLFFKQCLQPPHPQVSTDTFLGGHRNTLMAVGDAVTFSAHSKGHTGPLQRFPVVLNLSTRALWRRLRSGLDMHSSQLFPRWPNLQDRAVRGGAAIQVIGGAPDWHAWKRREVRKKGLLPSQTYEQD